MLFDQITGDLAKRITVLQGEERREEERSEEGGGGGVVVGQGYRKEGLSSAKSEAVEKCWPTWRWSEEAIGGVEEERRGGSRSFFCLGRWTHSSSPPWPGFCLEMAVN